MGWAVEEKREAVRIELQKSVDVMTRYVYFPGSILNISVRGMFIKTANPLPEGSEVEVVLYVEKRKKPQYFKGIVSWRSEASRTVPAGMGIQLTSENANLFADLAEELMRMPKAI